MKNLTFMQLHNLIVEAINQSGLSSRETYGCITAIEAQMRYLVLGDLRDEMTKAKKDED